MTSVVAADETQETATVTVIVTVADAVATETIVKKQNQKSLQMTC
jgi:hypothetical protein